eukprot:CAMPEP_0176054996 /NCGR_PEP_ID=MMETSP0120_2-20121206/27371_1 /TAXON_ID=160619 /ORGANISM="Kryptoperidinium foliaceum, Strain CCMP 1326" /LENGTH=120 /DNA_ID=CAMNT_0017388475 /DNA_START=110 /DNA_END=473 /DNA_ORIENTATION=+
MTAVKTISPQHLLLPVSCLLTYPESICVKAVFLVDFKLQQQVMVALNSSSTCMLSRPTSHGMQNMLLHNVEQSSWWPPMASETSIAKIVRTPTPTQYNGEYKSTKEVTQPFQNPINSAAW